MLICMTSLSLPCEMRIDNEFETKAVVWVRNNMKLKCVLSFKASDLDTYLTHIQSSAVARSSVLFSEWVHTFTARRSGWAVIHYYACLLLNLPLTAVAGKVKWSIALLIFASTHFNFHWFVCWVVEGHIGINVFSSLVCMVPTVRS